MGNIVIISNSFLKKMEEMTKILSLSNYVVTRRDRMYMESIFALTVFYSKIIDPQDIFTYSI